MRELSEAAVEEVIASIPPGAQSAIRPTQMRVNLNQQDNPYLAFGQECELLNGKWAIDEGRTAEFRITGESFDRIHPFKRFTQRRGGRAGTRFNAIIADSKTGQIIYSDQAMLAGWGDSSTQGQHFKLWLDESADRHPFAGFNRRKGQVPGDLFAVALVELNDDETAIDQTARAKLEGALAKPNAIEQPSGAAPVQAGAARAAEGAGAKAPKLSSQAHLLVTRPAFVRYLTETKPSLVKGWTPELARAYVKQTIDVESLSVLDRDPAAAKRYHDLVRRGFERWFFQDPGDHP